MAIVVIIRQRWVEAHLWTNDMCLDAFRTRLSALLPKVCTSHKHHQGCRELPHFLPSYSDTMPTSLGGHDLLH